MRLGDSRMMATIVPITMASTMMTTVSTSVWPRPRMIEGWKRYLPTVGQSKAGFVASACTSSASRTMTAAVPIHRP
jgi:hypothetical protein